MDTSDLFLTFLRENFFKTEKQKRRLVNAKVVITMGVDFEQKKSNGVMRLIAFVIWNNLDKRVKSGI